MYAKLLARALLSVVPIAVMAAIGVDQAYATPEWFVKGTPVTSNVTVKAKSVGGIVLEDTKTFGGATAIECKMTGEGTVGTGGKDKVTTFLPSECLVVKGPCTSIISVSAVHLPWTTQLATVESKTRDKITTGEGGSPGWEVECNTLLGKVKDTCSGETSTAVENVTEGVKLIYDAGAAHVNCTLGGEGTGVWKGTILEENSEGLTAKAAPSAPSTSCPVTSEGVTFDATVTAGNETELRKNVVSSTWVPVSESLKKCTSLTSYSTGLSKGEITGAQAEEYESKINEEVLPGDEIYKFKWHISGGATFETLGVASSSDVLQFEPVSSWDAGSITESEPASKEEAKEAGPTWTWGPLIRGSLTGLGTLAFESRLTLEIQTNMAKEIVNKTALISLTTGLLWSAAATKEEMVILNGNGVWCYKVISTVTAVSGFRSLNVTVGGNGWMLSVEVTGTLGASGQRQESAELCADGTTKRTVA
jgi:hypothetical protein